LKDFPARFEVSAVGVHVVAPNRHATHRHDERQDGQPSGGDDDEEHVIPGIRWLHSLVDRRRQSVL
jgi:hypothetical protein